MDTTWREERHPGAESHGEGKQGQGNPALAQWMQGQGSSREGDGAEKDDLIPNEVLARGKRPAWYDRLTLFPAALVLLTMARVGFAIFNIVHDCDEVFNYWEPLHFLAHGSGQQTWEYHPTFALRSWLYILLHVPLAKAVSSALGRPASFWALRAGLGVLSALSEAVLVAAVRHTIGLDEALAFLAFHLLAAGPALASGAFLPSTAAGPALCLASAFVLVGLPHLAILAGAVLVCLLWPVAAVALLPLALFVATQERLVPSLRTAIVSTAFLLTMGTAVDSVVYGRLTLGLWNFLKYNVVQGNSHLFGTEPWHFYIFNGLLAFNVVFVLFLIAPAALALDLFLPLKPAKLGTQAKPSEGTLGSLLRLRVLAAVVAPPVLWLATLSCQTHKEDRFVYPVYAHICLCAALGFSSLLRRTRTWTLRHALAPRTPVATIRAVRAAFTTAAVATASVAAAISLMRFAAVTTYYRAPLRLFPRLAAHLSEQGITGPVTVCMGTHWHMYPSAFHLPGVGSELRFLDEGFRGILPGPFVSTSTGWEGVNDRNQAHPGQFADRDECDFVVEVRKGSAEVRFVDTRGTVVASEPFLDMADARRAPTLHRVLRLPFIDWTTKLPVSQMVIVDTAMGTDADAAIETDGGDATA